MPSSVRPWIEGFVFSAAFALIVALNSGLVITEKPTEHNSDFHVFQASKALAAQGENPYDSDVLMAELSRPDGPYDVNFQTDTERYRRFFFNPPLWLTTLEVTGYWAAAFVTGSAFLFGIALWLWRSAVEWPIWAMIPVMYAWDQTILSYNGRIGQTGYLVAALIGISAWYNRRDSDGPESTRIAARTWRVATASALLAYKPHIWFAQFLVLVKQDRLAATKQFAISVAIGVASIIQFGPDIWLQYVRSVFETHDKFAFGLSITFVALDPRLDSTPVVLAMAVAAVLGVTFLLRSNLLRPPAEQVITMILIMMASGHALWYDWAWLLLVPLICGWNRWVTGLFLLVYPVSHWLEWYTSPKAWTLLLIAGILGNELRRNRSDGHEAISDGATSDGASREVAGAESADSPRPVSASAANP